MHFRKIMKIVLSSPTDASHSQPLPPRSSHLLETLLSNLDGMVYRCHGEGIWTMDFVSEGCHALLGYHPEELMAGIGISYQDITYPADRNRVLETVRLGLLNRRRYEMEYRIVRADGQVRWVWERGVGIFNAAGELIAMEGYVQDIDDRKQAGQALQEAERRYRSIFENAIEDRK